MKNEKYAIGIDIGSISTKAVVINSNQEIIAEGYIWTQGNPIEAVKELLKQLEKKVGNKKIDSIGTTGSARSLAGTILNANVVKNEITAHAIGALSLYPEIKTILEIGGQDSKIIIIENGVVTDYAMNTICAAGTGSFLSSQAKRLGISIPEFGEYALKAESVVKIAGRCTVFAESDLIHKAQMGHSKPDIIAGLCHAVVNNYLNNVGKGKTIKAPIIFQGGVSKNKGVVKAFEKNLNQKIIVDKHGHLMGALGIAILAQKDKNKIDFNFSIKDINFQTRGYECDGCPNNCEIVCVFKEGQFLDGWNNRCPVGLTKARKKLEKNY